MGLFWFPVCFLYDITNGKGGVLSFLGAHLQSLHTLTGTRVTVCANSAISLRNKLWTLGWQLTLSVGYGGLFVLRYSLPPPP